VHQCDAEEYEDCYSCGPEKKLRLELDERAVRPGVQIPETVQSGHLSLLNGGWGLVFTTSSLSHGAEHTFHMWSLPTPPLLRLADLLYPTAELLGR
jgi:hypothetical protein